MPRRPGSQTDIGLRLGLDRLGHAPDREWKPGLPIASSGMGSAFLPPGKSESMRLQGAYVATDLDMIRAQEMEEEDGGPPDAADGARDPRFRQAAERCIQSRPRDVRIGIEQPDEYCG